MLRFICHTLFVGAFQFAFIGGGLRSLWTSSTWLIVTSVSGWLHISIAWQDRCCLATLRSVELLRALSYLIWCMIPFEVLLLELIFISDLFFEIVHVKTLSIQARPDDVVTFRLALLVGVVETWTWLGRWCRNIACKFFVVLSCGFSWLGVATSWIVKGVRWLALSIIATFRMRWRLVSLRRPCVSCWLRVCRPFILPWVVSGFLS